MNVLCFDIETVPDVEGGRRLHGLDGLDEDEVLAALGSLRRQETGGSDFLRHHLHRIVAIAVAMRTEDGFRIGSLGEPDAPESELIQRFFDGVERFVPTLVSWNGSGFDLPVLHYRALLHGVSGPRYWDTGDEDTSFRYNNYLSRFHSRHTDLMDVLAGYQARAVAPLNEIALLLGFPGKLGMSGAQVLERVRRGDVASVRDYCEIDALNTYLIYLRYQLMRGRFTERHYRDEQRVVRERLVAAERPHFNAFLEAWPDVPDREADGTS